MTCCCHFDHFCTFCEVWVPGPQRPDSWTSKGGSGTCKVDGSRCLRWIVSGKKTEMSLFEDGFLTRGPTLA